MDTAVLTAMLTLQANVKRKKKEMQLIGLTETEVRSILTTEEGMDSVSASRAAHRAMMDGKYESASFVIKYDREIGRYTFIFI